jgi:catechol 2,3-dioxygenase
MAKEMLPMNLQSSTAEQTVPQSLREDRIIYGAVHLDVIDLHSSLAFWRELIGLGELPSEPGEARLGVDGRALVVLHPGAVRPAGRGHAGLYHLAIHLPDEVEFARVLVRLGQAGAAQSPTDHIFSKATYLHDPNGILLELTLETPERFGSIERAPGTFAMIDSDGRRRAPTEPLDVAAAIAPLGAGDPAMRLASGSYVGHVHLHVTDLQTANGFYRDVVGFEAHMNEEGFGMADLSAGGRFPHRIAINNWQGADAQQAPPGTAGMRHYELILQRPGELDALIGRAAAAAAPVSRHGDGSASAVDPAGNRFIVTQAST